MSKEGTKSFGCPPSTIGTSLKIEITEQSQILTLCEVQVLGRGNVMNMTILHCKYHKNDIRYKVLQGLTMHRVNEVRKNA